jgi:hypothetical protein
MKTKTTAWAVMVAVLVACMGVDAAPIRQPNVAANQNAWADYWNKTTTHGNSDIIVSGNSTAGYIGYVQYDLRGWTCPVGQDVYAVFARFTVTGTVPSSGHVYAHQANSNTWEASTLNWNNQPGYVSVPLTSVAPAFQIYLDVTNLFNNRIGDYMSIALSSDTPSTNYYAGILHASKDYPPVLEIFTIPVPEPSSIVPLVAGIMSLSALWARHRR